MGVVSESVVQQSHGPKNRSELGTNNQISARVSSSSALWFGLLHPHRTCAFPVSEPYITSNARASDIAHAGAPRATSALPPRALWFLAYFLARPDVAKSRPVNSPVERYRGSRNRSTEASTVALRAPNWLT